MFSDHKAFADFFEAMQSEARERLIELSDRGPILEHVDDECQIRFQSTPMDDAELYYGTNY